MSKKINFKLAIQRIKESNLGELSDSVEMFFMSYALLDGILDGTVEQFDEESKRIAKCNFVVNLVTAIETYFKLRIISKTDWEETAFDEFHLDQITINQAFTAFKAEENISREVLVAQSQSFQNLESIDQIFSTLTKKKFLKEIGEMKINTLLSFPAVTFNDNFPNWRNHVKQIFETRHKFIHEGSITELTNDTLEQYFLTILVLI